MVGLDTGQVSETIEGLVPVSTSPGGDRVLMSLSTAFYGDRFKEKQHHLFAMTPERKLQHLAKLELPEEGLDWSMLISSDLLAIKTKDGLSVHNLSTGERGIATKMMGWHQFDSDRNALFMYGLDRFESPSGDGSMVNGTKILAVDLATGKVLGLRSLPYMVFQFAPSPDGKRLVFRSDPDGNARGGGDIVTLDMTTGKEIGRLSLASKSKGLSWIDDRFVLIQGSGMLVLDTTTHMIVKRIETPRLIAVQGQALVSAVRSKQSSREAAVIVTPLNSQELIAASNKIDPKTALAVGPGSSMALDINTTADRKEVESILTAKLIDAGINVDPNAKTRLSVTTRRKSIQRKYREGVNKEQTVSVEEIRITLELKQDGQTQWSTEKVQSPPFSIMVREGETLNQAVARLSGKEAELRMVDRLPMPARVMSDQMLEQIEKITIE